MGSIKATTIQQRFGFQDQDLKTPGHDQIMLWLDSTVEQELITRIGEQTWTEKEISDFFSWLDKDKYHYDATWALPEKPPSRIRGKIWEFPITSGNYVIGFVDLRVNVDRPNLGINTKYSYGRDVENFCVDFTHKAFNFEVKTSIPSFGELIRQLRFYQEYDKGASYVVVSPDDACRDLLKAQGFGFLKYEV